MKQVIVIADDIMIVGKKPNHSNHDQALTTLLEMARRYNVQLNYEKLQYKKQEVDFFSDTYITSSHKPDKNKVIATLRCLPPQTRNKYNHLWEWSITFQIFC